MKEKFELSEKTISVLDKMKSFVKRGNILSARNIFLKNDLEIAFNELTDLLFENQFLKFHQNIKMFMGKPEYEKILGSVIFNNLSKNHVKTTNLFKLLSEEEFRNNKNVTDEFWEDFKNLCLKQKVLAWKEEFYSLKEAENLVKKSKYKAIREDYNPDYYEFKIHTDDLNFLGASFKEEMIEILNEQNFLDDFLSAKVDLRFSKKGFGTCSVAQFMLIANFLYRTTIVSSQNTLMGDNCFYASLAFMDTCKERDSFINEINAPIKYLGFPNINEAIINVYQDDYLDCPRINSLDMYGSDNKNKYHISDFLNYCLDVAVLNGKTIENNNYGISLTTVPSFQAILKSFKNYSNDLNDYNSLFNYKISLEKDSLVLNAMGAFSSFVLDQANKEYMVQIDTEDKLNEFQSKLARAFAVRELKKDKNWSYMKDEDKRNFIVDKAKEFLTEEHCNIILDLPYQVKKNMIFDIFDKKSSNSAGDLAEQNFKI